MQVQGRAALSLKAHAMSCTDDKHQGSQAEHRSGFKSNLAALRAALAIRGHTERPKPAQPAFLAPEIVPYASIEFIPAKPDPEAA